MKKRLKTLEPGAIFTYAKEKFVVLEQTEDGVFCLLAQSSETAPFHKGKDDPLNDYSKSTLRDVIENDWLMALVDKGADRKDFVEFEVDLSQTDQSEGYGIVKAYAAPLTLWQYGKYKNIIPLNEEDGWWLVTPLWTRWLRSPYTSNTDGAWYVGTDGSCVSDGCSNSYGVRPALKLNSLISVSVDGKDEDDRCDKRDNYTVDLSRVGTEDLLNELKARLEEHKDCCSCEEEDR